MSNPNPPNKFKKGEPRPRSSLATKMRHVVKGPGRVKTLRGITATQRSK